MGTQEVPGHCPPGCLSTPPRLGKKKSLRGDHAVPLSWCSFPCGCTGPSWSSCTPASPSPALIAPLPLMLLFYHPSPSLSSCHISPFYLLTPSQCSQMFCGEHHLLRYFPLPYHRGVFASAASGHSPCLLSSHCSLSCSCSLRLIISTSKWSIKPRRQSLPSSSHPPKVTRQVAPALTPEPLQERRPRDLTAKPNPARVAVSWWRPSTRQNNRETRQTNEEVTCGLGSPGQTEKHVC